MRQVVGWMGMLTLVSLMGCGSSDLSLINDAKRFEPEWMSLSEKVSFIDRYLRVTERRYPLDLGEVEPYINQSANNERSRMYSLKSQYDNMRDERDEIAKSFKSQKQDFVQTVKDFNEWHNKLMRNDLDEDAAREELNNFIRQHRDLKTTLSQTESELIKNIESHNSILRRMTTSLGVFTNFDIRYDQ